MTFKEAEDEIKNLDPNLNVGDEVFKAAALMLFGSLERKFTVNVLEIASGYEKKIISRTVRHLKNEGIWKQDLDNEWKVYHSGWFEEETGGISFWLDVGRALGHITANERT